MADSAYQAFVEVLPDFSSFNSTASRQMSSILGNAGTVGGESLNGGILSSIPKIAGPLVAAVAALGIGKLIGETIGNGIRFGLDGIDLASDLNESFNATKVTFGAEVSAQITALGADSATRLGLTSRAFNEIATQFSAFATTVRADSPASFIDELTTRGSDFASVYNLEVSEALQLFQSGLAGETEPLRKFGLDLSAASVNAFAYANGIGTAGKELTEAEKVQARYGLLLSQTSAVQGDFANTSDELANQQRILAASYEESQTKLGTALLPTMLLFTQLANDTLIPLLNDVVAKIGPELATALGDSAPAFVELVEAVAPLLPDLIRLSVEALPPMLSLFTALAPLLIDLALSTSSFTTTSSALFALLSGDTSVSQFIGTLQGASGALGTVYAGAMTAGAAVGVFIYDTRKNLGEAQALFMALPGQITSAVGNLGATLYSSGRSLIQGFINGINDMLRPVGNAIGGLMDYVAGFFPRSPAKRGPFSGSGWTAVAAAGRAITDQFAGGIGTDAVNSALQGMVLPSMSSGASVSASALVPSRGGAFNNYGTIQVTDEKALVAEVEKRQRDANALAGIGLGVIA